MAFDILTGDDPIIIFLGIIDRIFSACCFDCEFLTTICYSVAGKMFAVTPIDHMPKSESDMLSEVKIKVIHLLPLICTLY